MGGSEPAGAAAGPGASERREPLVLLIAGAVALVVSGIGPRDRGTWWLEVLPVLVAGPLLVGTARRFPLPPPCYRLVFLHALARCTPLRGGWLFFVATCVVLSVSAAYELLEWLVALLFGAGAESFLGTQGDEWDAQWDMFLALCGALLAQLLLARAHDRQLARLCRHPRGSAGIE
jgi:putative membrane protein